MLDHIEYKGYTIKIECINRYFWQAEVINSQICLVGGVCARTRQDTIVKAQNLIDSWIEHETRQNKGQD